MWRQITDYGASPDATPESNSSAIWAAIDAGPGVVYVPAGIYTVDVAVTLPSNVWLEGEGPETSVLRMSDGMTSRDVVSLVPDARSVAVVALGLDGNCDGNPTHAHGLRSSGHENLTIRDVRISNCDGYGIGLQYGLQIFTIIQNVYIYNTGSDGIDVKNRTDDNTALFIDNVWVRRAASGPEFDNSVGIDIRGPAKLSNIFVRVETQGAKGIRFRPGSSGSSNGYGGHNSSLMNFEVRASGSLDNIVGLTVEASNVQVCNGFLANCSFNPGNAAYKNIIVT